jgi:NTP pyrophosphatase (non-canonical NTP hydrolase)
MILTAQAQAGLAQLYAAAESEAESGSVSTVRGTLGRPMRRWRRTCLRSLTRPSRRWSPVMSGALREELRDVLLQVVFHARIAAERGDGTGYNIDDVADGIVDKLVPRHPQVFGDVTVSGADEVKRNWRAIKREEKKAQAERQAGAGPAVCAVRAGPHAVRAARFRAGRSAAAQGGQGGNPR